MSKVGFLTSASNFDETLPHNKPARDLRDAFLARGHDVVLLDPNKAEKTGKEIFYPGLPVASTIDVFLSFGYYKSPEHVPYMEQIKWLSDRYPSPMPYFSHTITNNKTIMNEVFQSALLPVPVSYDGNNVEARETVLADIARRGTQIVLKPDFGGGGYHIEKVGTVQDAWATFAKFDDRGEAFLMQEYIECHGVDYRAYVVEDTVIAGIKRQATDGEWRTNYSLGSKVTAHKFTQEQEQDAITAMQAANLGFGATDILIDPKTNAHYICEINDSAGTESIESVHPGLNIADHVIDMMERKYIVVCIKNRSCYNVS